MELWQFTEYITLRKLYVAAPDEETAYRYAITQGDFRTRHHMGPVQVITRIQAVSQT